MATTDARPMGGTRSVQTTETIATGTHTTTTTTTQTNTGRETNASTTTATERGTQVCRQPHHQQQQVG